MLLERLAQLDLLGVALFGIEFGAETYEVLRILGGFVAFTGSLLTPVGLGISTGREVEGWSGWLLLSLIMIKPI